MWDCSYLFERNHQLQSGHVSTRKNANDFEGLALLNIEAPGNTTHITILLGIGVPVHFRFSCQFLKSHN